MRHIFNRIKCEYAFRRTCNLSIWSICRNKDLSFIITGTKKFTEEDSIDQYLQEYIKYGGFPSVVFSKDDQMKSDILKGIYNSILLKDVSIRGNITQIDVLMKLSLYLLNNIGKPVSSYKISNYFKSMNQVVKPETINK